MDKQINYEDSIFILNIRLRLISDTLLLDPDPELFLDKIIDDLEFFDKVMAHLMDSLMKNTMLIDREEVLAKLADLEWRFDQLLTGIRGNSQIINALNLESNKMKIFHLKNNSTYRRKTLESSNSSSVNNDNTPVVSSYELTQLLQDFQ